MLLITLWTSFLDEFKSYLNKLLRLTNSTQVGSSYQQPETKTNNNLEVEAIKNKLSSAISLILEYIDLTEIFASASGELYKNINLILLFVDRFK